MAETVAGIAGPSQGGRSDKWRDVLEIGRLAQDVPSVSIVLVYGCVLDAVFLKPL